MASRQPRKPSIGLNSCSSRHARLQLLDGHAELLGDGSRLLRLVRQELVQRRIEQADRHRQAGHDLEQRLEVGALHRQDLGERAPAAGLVVGADHLAHGEDAARLEEHVLGAAQADALGAEVDAPAAHRAACRRWRARRACGPRPPTPSPWRNRPTARAGASSRGPSSTSPVAPSIVMTSPLRRVLPRDRHGAGLVVDPQASRRRTRRAGPCRAPPRPRGSSCRRAW